MENGTIECWRHGSRFDLRSGAVLNLTAVEPVPVQATCVDGDQVYVDVDGQPA